MQIKATIKPGQKGSKRFVERFGDRLVCVRYRYDKQKQRRLTTVELVIDERPWVYSGQIPDTRQVMIRIGFEEIEARERVKRAGGKWDISRKLWSVPYDKVMELGMESRVVV